MGRGMKNKIKNIFKILAVTAGCLMFASFSPSLDGRAVVVDKGVFPQGLFAKTVGYLPGDIISVTNIAGDATVDILVIGALDPSEGVAIMLSPEAAEAMGIDSSANNIVKITKRSGQDDQVFGNAVISKSSAEIDDFDDEEFESIGAEQNSDAFDNTENEEPEVPEAVEEAEEEEAFEEDVIEEEETADEEFEEEEIPVEDAEEENEEEAFEDETPDAIEEAAEEEAFEEDKLDELPAEEESEEESVEEEPEEFEEEAAEPEIEEETAEEETVEEDIPEEEESLEEEAFDEETPADIPEETKEAEDDVPAAEAFEADELDDLPAETEAEPENEVSEETEENETDEYEAIVLVPADANPPESEEDEVEDVISEDDIDAIDEEITLTPLVEETPAEPEEPKPEPEPKAVTSYDRYMVPSLKNLESGKYYIQIAVYSSEDNILDVINKYGTNYPITIVPMAGGSSKQILIGPVTMDEYKVVLERFKSYGFKDAFLRKIK